MALVRDPLLHEEQKQTILRIYQSFLFENGGVPAPQHDGDDDGEGATLADAG
jgi:hypothetical protein